MSIDRSFTRETDFREVSDRDLYYDLEFTYRQNNEQHQSGTESVILYIFLISLALNFVFGVQQLFTLIIIVLYGGIQQYFPRVFLVRQKVIGIVLMFVANVIDHIIDGSVVSPGRITTEQLGVLVWVLEIGWLILITVEFLSSFAPETDTYSENTITPATPRAKAQYNSLKQRVAGSEYEITDFEEDIDTSLLQTSFRNIVQYLIASFGIILALDLLIWEIVSILSGGNNIQEAYFVSGVSFIIYGAIIFSSARLFADDKSS